MSRSSGVIGAGYMSPADRSWTRRRARRSMSPMTHTITRDELRAGLEAGTITVVETLRAEHFAQGHIPGAVHLHMEDVAERAASVLPDRDATVVTYCSNIACRNSEVVAAQL